MPDRRESLRALFRELVQLTVLDEGSPSSFRARAYENALEAISSFPGDLERISEKELTKVPGLGASTARKVREFYETGTIAKLETLRQRYPPEFVELTRVPGLGPRTARRLESELGVRSLADLRAALEAQRVRTVKGLGAKVEENLRRALERREPAGKENRRPIAEVLPIAKELVAALEALPGVERARYCGSLRRFRETIADVDLLVASTEPASGIEGLLKLGAVRQVLERGDTKAALRTATGLQVDLRVVAPGQFGAACQYFTGSKAHNIKLRQRALARGWLLNEYGLQDSKTGEVIAAASEEAIYEALGLQFVPPPMREDKGEVERAAEGTLPPVARLEDLRGDLHVHTALSGDGRSTLEEMVAAAEARAMLWLVPLYVLGLTGLAALARRWTAGAMVAAAGVTAAALPFFWRVPAQPLRDALEQAEAVAQGGPVAGVYMAAEEAAVVYGKPASSYTCYTLDEPGSEYSLLAVEGRLRRRPVLVVYYPGPLQHARPELWAYIQEHYALSRTLPGRISAALIFVPKIGEG